MKLEQIFESVSSEILTEDVKLKLSALYESQINEAISLKEKELEEKNRVEINEFKASLVDQVDEYMNYIVEEYVKENKGVIIESVKVDQAKKVLSLFANVVDQFNLSLSEHKAPEAVLVDENKKLNEKVNSLFNETIELKKDLKQVLVQGIIAEESAALETEMDRARFTKLANTLTVDENIVGKIEAILESVKEVKASPAKVVEAPVKEEVIAEAKKDIVPSKMSDYVSKL